MVLLHDTEGSPAVALARWRRAASHGSKLQHVTVSTRTTFDQLHLVPPENGCASRQQHLCLSACLPPGRLLIATGELSGSVQEPISSAEHGGEHAPVQCLLQQADHARPPATTRQTACPVRARYACLAVQRHAVLPGRAHGAPSVGLIASRWRVVRAKKHRAA